MRIDRISKETTVADMTYDVRTLNGLITTTIDSVDGYRAAAQDAHAGRYAAMFAERANERAGIAEKMKSEVRRLGGEPEDGGSMLAGAHRAFMGLREIVTGKDDTAIIAEVERGEDVIKSRFEKALADDKLSAEAQMMISACWASVKDGHNQMLELKNATQSG